MGLPPLEALTTKLAERVDDTAADEQVSDAAGEALDLVTKYLTKAIVDEEPVYYDVPDAACMRACLNVGSDLYWGNKARIGIVGVDGLAEPMRARLDPMQAAYPILRHWVGGGIA